MRANKHTTLFLSNRKNPFKTPEGYFERMEEEIIQRIPTHKKPPRWYWLVASIALILLIGGYYSQTVQQAETDEWYANYLLTQVDETTLYDFSYEEE